MWKGDRQRCKLTLVFQIAFENPLDVTVGARTSVLPCVSSVSPLSLPFPSLHGLSVFMRLSTWSPASGLAATPAIHQRIILAALLHPWSFGHSSPLCCFSLSGSWPSLLPVTLSDSTSSPALPACVSAVTPRPPRLSHPPFSLHLRQSEPHLRGLSGEVWTEGSQWIPVLLIKPRSLCSVILGSLVKCSTWLKSISGDFLCFMILVFCVYFFMACRLFYLLSVSCGRVERSGLLCCERSLLMFTRDFSSKDTMMRKIKDKSYCGVFTQILDKIVI